MFEKSNFVIQQLQRAQKAMAQPELAGFKPDGKSLADVSNLLATLESTKATLMTRMVALDFARGALEVAAADMHHVVVAVYAAMRSIYRNDPDSLRAIRRIVKPNESPRQTLVRAEMTAGVWATLPDMPSSDPPAPFKLGALTLALFQAALAPLREKFETCVRCESELEMVQGTFGRITAEDSDFVSAVVAQGRALYARGTTARSWVETIPLAPNTQAPLRAIISAASSPAAGAVHLEFRATRATSYTIQHRLASDVEFVTVAAEVTEESWDFIGLPAGNHQYIVFGTNSRGDGPVSEIATVPVAAAVAA